MSKCTTESNVDESRGTFHFISRHELRLTATKEAGCYLTVLCSITNYNNCAIAARILFIQVKKKTDRRIGPKTLKYYESTPFLTFSCYHG